MQTTSLQFRQLAAGYVRPLSWALRIAWAKAFDPTLEFFTLDTSVLDGDDILAPEGGEVITEWDKYLYADYTPRVINAEWVREFSMMQSVTAAMLDLTLDNHSSLFTRGGGSPLEDYLIPRRPIRFLAGFNGLNLPQFVGLTTKAPEVDRIGRTASLHAQDFLSYIFTRKLDQSVMYQDLRVDEILENLFDLVGVLPSQLHLDKALTTVPFAYFEKDMTFGYAIGELIKAEFGSLYMDEMGFIVFKNRLRVQTTPVMTLDESNVISYELSDEEEIINTVTVKSHVRIVQPQQPVFNLSEILAINPGETITKFFQLDDPTTSIQPIIAYTVNSDEFGEGTDLYGDIDIVSQTLFGTSVKVEIENTGSTKAYILDMTIDGTPAQIKREVDVVEKDQTSIDDFEEQTYELESIYIQDEDTAEAIALTIIRHFKDYGSTVILEIKGTTALQIADRVTLGLTDVTGDHVITKIVNGLREGKLYQRLTAQQYDIPDYFILSSDSVAMSLLDGTDVLGA